MAISNKRGKVEKAKKGESKSKTKPKTVVKSKVATKVKKLVATVKTALKTTVKKAKTVAPRVSPAKKGLAKTKTIPPPAKKTPVLKVAKSTTKSSQTKTKGTANLKEQKIVSPTKVAKKNPGNFELGVVLRTGRRPQAIINKKKIETDDMGEEKLRYSEEELKDFEVLILEKLDKAKKELNYMKEMLSKKNDEGTDNTAGTMKLLEDGADTLEKENFSQLAVRQQKFVTQLENALARIKNGTYGICIDTGKLIPKERLKAVPHTQHSIEAKLNRRD